MTVIPNGTTRDWMAMGESEVDPASVGLDPERFVWTYAGNVGLSQGLEVAVEAARQLGPGFQLADPRRRRLQAGLRRAATAAPPGRWSSATRCRRPEASRLMRASDALLVSLADKPALGKTVPVKLYDSAALGRPIVVAAPGEPRRISEQTGAALTVPPGDAGALAAAVRRLREDEGLRRGSPARRKQFAAAHLREDGVRRLEAVLDAAGGAAL